MTFGCRRFVGRTVVVTGGASGIGKAAATRFAAEGASVVIADADVESARAVAESVNDAGGGASAYEFDQGDMASIDSLAAALTGGRLHVLCVNAAVGAPSGPLAEVDVAEWDRIHAVNLRGAFLTVQRLLPLLARTPNPSVVFTASLAALYAHPGRLPYAASKGGLVALSRSLAVELAPDGVRVNAVCPGGTMTPLAASVATEGYDAAVEQLRARIPLGRIAEPEDVAAALVFLASDDARHITGIDLVVDGGQSVAL